MGKINFTPLVENEFTEVEDEVTESNGISFTPSNAMEEEEEDVQDEEDQIIPQKYKDLVVDKVKSLDVGKPLDVASQLSLRGLETIASLPRGGFDFLGAVFPEKLVKKGFSKVGLGRGAEFLIDTAKKYYPGQLFPTQKQTRDFTKTIFGDLFEPKNELEEKLGEGFGEFVSLVFPFLGPVKPKKAFLLATGANAAKETGEYLGVSEKKSNLMKFGTYVLGAFIHPKWAENFYRKTYKAANNVLPQNAKVSTQSLAPKLDELEKGLRKSGISSADSGALKQIENLRGEMQGALMPVDSLVEFKKKINIARGDIFKQLEGNKSGIKTANRNMENVSKAADDALELYAKQNPTWGKFHREANNAFAASKNSERASKFLKSKLPKIGITHVGLSALLGHFVGLKTAAIGGAGAAAGVPVYVAAQTLNKIMRSPPLRKEYFRLLQESARGNLFAVQKSARALDKSLTESEN